MAAVYHHCHMMLQRCCPAVGVSVDSQFAHLAWIQTDRKVWAYQLPSSGSIKSGNLPFCSCGVHMSFRSKACCQ